MRLSLIIITLKTFLTVCSEGYMSVEDGNLSGNKENKVSLINFYTRKKHVLIHLNIESKRYSHKIV